MNNGKIFSSFGGMQLLLSSLSLYQGIEGKMYWISWDLRKPDLLENNTSNTKKKIKPQIKNKMKRSTNFWNY